jgi:hypothetical protein
VAGTYECGTGLAEYKEKWRVLMNAVLDLQVQ